MSLKNTNTLYDKGRSLITIVPARIAADCLYIDLVPGIVKFKLTFIGLRLSCPVCSSSIEHTLTDGMALEVDDIADGNVGDVIIVVKERLAEALEDIFADDVEEAMDVDDEVSTNIESLDVEVPSDKGVTNVEGG